MQADDRTASVYDRIKSVEEKREKQKSGRIRTTLLSQQALLIAVIIASYVVFSATTTGFLTISNFYTILRSMSIVAVLAVGVTFAITLGEIDLSIQSVPGLSAIIFCALIDRGYSVAVSILGAFVIAIVFGFVNGFIIHITSLPSIIVTLATSLVAIGFSGIISEHRAIVISRPGFVALFAGTIRRFPVISIWMMLVVVIGYIVLEKMQFGRNIAFVGDNKDAAKYAGLKIGSTIIMSFVIVSMYSFAAGMLGAAQASNATPGMLQQYMLTAVAATVIGGTLMSGGKSNVFGAVLGAFFLATLENGFLMSGIDQWVLYLINGVVILGTLTWQYTSLQSRNKQ